MRPRHVVIGAAALLGLLHPANAEAWLRAPLVTVAALAVGVAIVLWPSRRTMLAPSSVALALVGWALLAKAPERGPEIAYERAVEAGSAVAAISESKEESVRPFASNSAMNVPQTSKVSASSGRMRS